ncbi:hypothetical protein JCM11641_000739 [Rhodosporidiobolus odoratus]
MGIGMHEGSNELEIKLGEGEGMKLLEGGGGGGVGDKLEEEGDFGLTTLSTFRSLAASRLASLKASLKGLKNHPALYPLRNRPLAPSPPPLPLPLPLSVLTPTTELNPDPDPDPYGAPSLPQCSRTLLYLPRSHRGFASEYLRFVRNAAVVAGVDKVGLRLEEEEEGEGEEERVAQGGKEGRKEGYEVLGNKCRELGNPKCSPRRFATPQDRARLYASGKLKSGCNICTTPQNARVSISLSDGEVYARAVLQAIEREQEVEGKGGLTEGGEIKVVIMSERAKAVEYLLAAWAASTNAKIAGLALPALSGVKVVSLAQEAERLGLRFAVSDAKEQTQTEEEAESGGFDSHVFGKAPLSERISATLPFIRDLTFLGRYSSSLILTESSNVGGLLTLLAGSEKVLARRVISADVRWFPNAYYD